MAARIGLKLKEQIKQVGVRNAYKLFKEAINDKRVDVHRDFSLKEMAVSFFGDKWDIELEKWASRNMGNRDAFRLRESGGVEAVDGSAFAHIGGQLLIDRARDKYNAAAFIGDDIFSTEPITNGNLGPHIEPWLSDVIDDPAPINQGMPYPATTFSPNYITFPAPQKYGRICRVTMEMIAGDKTKQAIDSAESVGRRTRIWVEYQQLKVFLGLVNNHSWNGTTYNTYLSSGAWNNRLTGFTLDNWRSFNTIEQLFAQMVDPTTGIPIDIEGADLFVMPGARMNARRLLNATAVRTGDITTGAGDQTESGNPVDTSYRLLSSRHARKVAIDSGTYTAAQADTIVIAGDFKRAFVWREVYPPKFVQAPPMNPYEFEQDIILAVKSSVYGVGAVRDPRFVVFAFNTAAV